MPLGKRNGTRKTRHIKRARAVEKVSRKASYPAAAKLAAALRDRQQVVQQQVATADILKVIAASPSDVQPVFDAVVRSAVRLCGALFGFVGRFDGEKLHLAAQHNFPPAALEIAKRTYPCVPDRTRGAGRSILTKSVARIEDIYQDPDYYRAYGKKGGWRRVLAVPMTRGDVVLGTISLAWADPGPIPDSQVELLQTFADQAVIAIENTRLFNETRGSLEQQTAISEILRAISRSPSDLQPVFDTILERAIRLCDGAVASLWRFDGGKLHYAAARNATDGAVAYMREHPLELGTWNPTPQAALERRAMNVLDVFANPDYRPLIPAGTTGTRPNAGTVLAVPLLRGDELFGVITIWRYQKRRYSEREVDLVRTFTDQAVIAIENARLFNETKEALEQQTATADVLRVISSSPSSVQPVFEAILGKAMELCEAHLGLLFLLEGTTWRLMSHRGASPKAEEAHRSFQAGPHTGLGRMLRERQPVHIEDLVADGGTVHRDPVRMATIELLGARTFLAAPLLKDGEVIGAVVIYRREVRPFREAQIRLLGTFADQAVIAIENVRLFNETREALEQQTATAEILRVISSSPSDMQPVFDSILEHAMRLCDAGLGTVGLYDGKRYAHRAQRGGSPEYVKRLFDAPFVPGAQGTLGRMIAEKRPVHIPDYRELPAYREREPRAVATVELGGARTYLAVPMLKDGQVLGGITIRRAEVRPFTQQQIDLLSTFANQAVIAIENVRLFNETKEALEQQTATAEILRVISGSPTDEKPVFEAIVASAAHLFGRTGRIRVVVDGALHLRARSDAGRVEPSRDAPIAINRDSLGGRVVLERTALQVGDTQASDAPAFAAALGARGGYRAMAAAPLLREGNVLGVVSVTSPDPGALSDKEMALLQTFADQAVIAIENARLFREIQDKGAQLEIANKHKSEFLANMSHELRTPLNAIIGFSEVLSDRMFGEVNEKQLEYLKDIHESGRHLLSLINDILDLSKIEAGRMDLELSSFDLPGALSNAMTLIRERAQRHGIRLGLEVDQQLGEVQADERKFKQIMLNLLSNAVKFTPDGGQVDVSAKRLNGKLEVAVRDTGIGIAPEDQAAVFEEFKQVGRDRMRKAEGTGLGLALTRRFVELHGGAIRLESAPGKGSTFTVELPLSAGGLRS